ncbi:MAG: DUF427 domain-containing protein [Halioglobus sp.]
MWKHTGKQRPAFADRPGDGQESVWDYPRPPALQASTDTVVVGEPHKPLAKTARAMRVLETASPPTYYLPPDDVDCTQLVRTADQSFCEWKGVATYWALAARPEAGPIAWSYDDPSERFRAIDDYFSFYPGRIACFVEGERVLPQPGQFYGGWVTRRIAGPFKGEPGSGHW